MIWKVFDLETSLTCVTRNIPLTENPTTTVQYNVNHVTRTATRVVALVTTSVSPVNTCLTELPVSRGVPILTVMSRINSVYSVVLRVRVVVMVLVLIKGSEVSPGLFL